MGNTSSSKYANYGRNAPSYAPPPAPPSQAVFGFPVPGGLASFQSPTMRFRAIADHYTSVDQVQEALRKGGLESSNLIVAVDFTKSNEWTGKRSFGGKSLHAIGEEPSPYEEAITAIGRTLSAFDDDGLIPCYGFGDATTGDKSVFSFNPGGKPCNGLNEMLWRYKELCPYVRMAGPTSFAPAIRQACRIVERSGNQYHILLLVADGQVSRSVDLPPGRHSEQEQDTIDAIEEASYLPLSIVMVGVGDGPWDLMKDFDDALPQRQFDNFQFVNFTEVAATTAGDTARREATFALRALMEIPEQYMAIQRLGLLSKNSPLATTGRSRFARHGPSNPPLDPPVPPRFTTSDFPTQAAAAGPGPGSSKGAPPARTSDADRRLSGGDASGAGKSTQPDAMYLCPITQDIMTDPVIATDGYTYERSAITAWLRNKTVSPMTNQPMPGGITLIPNHGLRSSIMQWKQDHGMS